MIELAGRSRSPSSRSTASYNAAQHDELFEEFGANGLDPSELAPLSRLPRLPRQRAARRVPSRRADGDPRRRAAGQGALVQSDDLFEPVAHGRRATSRRRPRAGRSRTWRWALGLCTSLQSSSSTPFPVARAIVRGHAHPPARPVPRLLRARRRAEAVAVSDGGGGAWSRARFPPSSTTRRPAPTGRRASALDDNPQPELDWPIQRFDVRGRGASARSRVDLAFTFVDFVAGDRALRRAFRAAALRRRDESDLAPIDEMLLRERGRGCRSASPACAWSTSDDRLHSVVVDERLMREARRCARDVAQPAGARRRPQLARRTAARARARGVGGVARSGGRRAGADSGGDGRRRPPRRRCSADAAAAPRSRRGRERPRPTSAYIETRALLDLQRVHADQRQDVRLRREQAGLHRRPEGGHLSRSWSRRPRAARCRSSIRASRGTRTSPGSPSCWCAPRRSAERGRRQAVT